MTTERVPPEENVEDLKKLVYAIALRAYEDICRFHELVMSGKPSKVREQNRRKTNSPAGRPYKRNKISTAELHYDSAIAFFTRPYFDDDGHEHPSFFKYYLWLVDNDGDYVAQRTLENVLLMEKERNQRKMAVA